VCPNGFGAQFRGDIARCAFQGRLDGTHQVIVFDHPLRTIEGHAKQASARCHQRFGELRHAKETVAGHVHRRREALRTAVDHPTVEILLRREGDRVQQEIEATPAFLHLAEKRLEFAGDAYIARRSPFDAELVDDRLDPVLCLFVEIGGGKPGAAPGKCLRASCRDAMFVCDPDDEAALAGQIYKRCHWAVSCSRLSV